MERFVRCALVLLAVGLAVASCSTLNTFLSGESDPQLSSGNSPGDRRIRVPPTVEEFEAGQVQSPHLIDER